MIDFNSDFSVNVIFQVHL